MTEQKDQTEQITPPSISPVPKDVSTADVSDTASLVPITITIGLAIFSLVLSLAGYVVQLVMGVEPSDIVFHALKLVPAFVIGVPTLFWLGAQLMNRFAQTNIQTRNALTFGWLISCVTMLWLMGTYS